MKIFAKKAPDSIQTYKVRHLEWVALAHSMFYFYLFQAFHKTNVQIKYPSYYNKPDRKTFDLMI